MLERCLLLALCVACLAVMEAWLEEEDLITGRPDSESPPILAQLPYYYPLSLCEAIAACAAFLCGSAAAWPDLPWRASNIRREVSPLTGRPRIALPPTRQLLQHALQNRKLENAWFAHHMRTMCPGERKTYSSS